MPRDASRRGFSLIEVLIASAILGMAFVALAGMMSQSLRNIERMQPHELALLHARERMTELLLEPELNPGRSGGQWDDGYRWQAEIAPAQGVSPTAFAGQGLFRIRLQISWGDLEHPKSYVVETTQLARQASAAAQP